MTLKTNNKRESVIKSRSLWAFAVVAVVGVLGILEIFNLYRKNGETK